MYIFFILVILFFTTKNYFVNKIGDELYTTSVLNTASSLVVNEAQQDYAGECYEGVAIHTQLALSFIEDSDLKSARVEAKKINSKLHKITLDYGSENNNYSEDGFARYLAGVIYEAQGNIDDAIIDYRKALSLFKTPPYANYYHGPVPRQLVAALWRLLKKRDRTNQLNALEKTFTRTVAIEKSREIPPQGEGEVVVIHSTVKPGTTKNIQERSSIPILLRRILQSLCKFTSLLLLKSVCSSKISK